MSSWKHLEHTLVTLTTLVNTAPRTASHDLLPDVGAVRRLIQERTITEVADPVAEDVDALRLLRTQLRSIVEAPDEARVALVNALLARASITPRLVEHDNLGPHLHYFPPYATIAEHLTADIAMALAQLHATGESSRLRICARPGCGRSTLDSTKNRSRIYCDGPACGNRVNAAAYRARRAGSKPVA